MQDCNQCTAHQSVLEQVFDWYRGARVVWAKVQDIDSLSPEEITWMARDVALAEAELLEVIRQPEGAAGLLHRRLKALKLDPEEIRRLSPLLLADLQRTCTCCRDKERCAAEMAEDPNPSGWETYCPNSGTLRTLT